MNGSYGSDAGELPGADGGNGTESDPSLIDSSLAHQVLQDILQSAPFRASKQGQRLLTYVVQHSLAGHDHLLRERVIGSEVFGRAPDYDTANDPIVRARVAEVRKRLAQYYVSEDHSQIRLKIVIPPGSYRARFHLAAESSELAKDVPRTEPVPREGEISPAALLPALRGGQPIASASPQRQKRWWRLAALAVLLVVAASAVAVYLAPSPTERAFRAFWSPAFGASRPVLIYTGTNVVYRLSPEFLEKYRDLHHLPNTGPEFVVELAPNQTVPAKDLRSSSNAYVTVGDVSACTAIVAMLAKRNKTYELRYATDISPGDLRAAPTVLIGAFNNPWTLNITDPLRYTFVRGDTIEDRLNPDKSWSVHLKPDGTTVDDYAIITRLLNSDAGRMVLTAAGIGQYGTQAASEFLSNPQRIAGFAARAPRGWEHKNVQIVLHVKVVDDTPAGVDIAAIHFW